MDRIIRKVTPRYAPLPKLKRVAAYARVSSGKDAMLHSLSAQVSYYSQMIQQQPGWQYVGVFTDEAKTGTKDSREGFQQLLETCRDGRVDVVITKSISRFARNTVTLLETIRELKSLGIDVFFEEQNIHTISSDGELMLSILASYAQEESLSASENQKWRIRRNFEQGKPWNGTMLGYRYKDGTLVIEPSEAKTVRRIFREYLSGKGVLAIANGLNADETPTRKGNIWHKRSVTCVLQNYAYTGNLLLQKTFRENHLTKLPVPNRGQFTKYHAEGTHEPIISMDDFMAAQTEMEKRSAKYAPARKRIAARYPFSGMIICSNCGMHYRRKITARGPIWVCGTYNDQGKAACSSKAIPETVLTELSAEIDVGDLTEICAMNDNRVAFHFSDGSKRIKHWKNRSRAESWTPEMREKARQKAMERNRHNG